MNSYYEELTRDTAELTKRIQLKWDIISAVLIVLMAALVIVGIRLIWEEHRDRKEAKQRSSVNSFGEYRPTVTETVQYDRYGTEYRRMGPAGRVPE